MLRNHVPNVISFQTSKSIRLASTPLLTGDPGDQVRVLPPAVVRLVLRGRIAEGPVLERRQIDLGVGGEALGQRLGQRDAIGLGIGGGDGLHGAEEALGGAVLGEPADPGVAGPDDLGVGR